MPITTPDWLTKHNGELRLSNDQRYWVVYLSKEPQYLIHSLPVGGKHGVEVEQSINGRRLESKQTYASDEEAVKGGLEDLRKKLGW
jgi:hypothetical protein